MDKQARAARAATAALNFTNEDFADDDAADEDWVEDMGNLSLAEGDECSLYDPSVTSGTRAPSQAGGKSVVSFAANGRPACILRNPTRSNPSSARPSSSASRGATRTM